MTSRSDGFTLIETLVALAIFTGFLIVFNNGITGSWRGIAAAEADLRALAVARMLLEEANVAWPLATGTHEGRSASGLAYRIVVQPYQAPGGKVQDNATSAHWVAVTVAPRGSTGGPRRQLTLQTLKRRAP